MKKNRSVSFALAFFLLARPWQWIKNVAVFIPLIFAGRILDPSLFWHAFIAFVALSLLSSSHYIINDIIDIKSDQMHPFKRYRPLASAIITKLDAWKLWAVFVVLGFLTSASLGMQFFLIAVLFSSLHYLSLLIFRKVPILDVLSLATGYVLRLAAGQIAGETHISVWLFLSALSLALLFAIGKRRFELRIAEEHTVAVKHMYSAKLLDSYIAMFGAASFLSYAYFTFLTTFAIDATQSTISLYQQRKWLMMTLPFALYGLLRYLQQLYVGKRVSYSGIILMDKPLLVAAFLWGVTVLSVIYGIGR